MLSFRQFLTEKPLTPSQRLQRSRQLKRIMPKLQQKRKLALKKKASVTKIKSRAEKQARELIRKKLLKGKDYATLSFSQKIAVDKKLETKKGAIKKLTKKLIPKLKQAEAERLKKISGNS